MPDDTASSSRDNEESINCWNKEGSCLDAGASSIYLGVAKETWEDKGDRKHLHTTKK